MSEAPVIKRIVGLEPRRKNEHPFYYCVGDELEAGKVLTHIVEYTQNLGNYGIVWYHLIADTMLVGRVNALSVAEVYYEENAFHPAKTEEAT